MTQAQAHQHFAIRGLELGMTSQQVRRVLYAQRKVITYAEKEPCVSDYLQQKRKNLSISKAPQSCLTTIEAPDKDGRLILSFIEDFPTRPGTVVLDTINIVPDPGKSQQISDLRTFAHNIFGNPNFVNPDHGDYLQEAWCTQSCKSLSQVYGGFGHGPTTAHLAKEGDLIVRDLEYTTMRFDNIRRYLAAHGITMPDEP